MADNTVTIQKIIQNNTKPHFSAPAKVFVSKYWQPILQQVADMNGTDSPIWRKAVKMLTNFSLYMDPSIREQHANVEASLLPSLINTMKQQVEAMGGADQTFNTVVKGLLDGSAEPIASSPEPVAQTAAVETTPEPVAPAPANTTTDENVLAFDITADDLPPKETKPREEFEHGNTVDFESFKTEAPAASASPSTSEPEDDLSLDMSAFDLDNEKPEATSTPSLDEEPLELDLSEDSTDIELEEPTPAPATETPSPSNDVEDGLELPPLELDLSDFEDDLDKPK